VGGAAVVDLSAWTARRGRKIGLWPRAYTHRRASLFRAGQKSDHLRYIHFQEGNMFLNFGVFNSV